MAFWKMVGLLVRPRMPDFTSSRKRAAGEVAALQVVEPRALALLGVEVLEYDSCHFFFPASAVARATTLATLIPSFSNTTLPGALAPKRSMPMLSSAQRDQPNVVAASTDSVGTPFGQHLRLRGSALRGEAIPRRHADDARRDTRRLRVRPPRRRTRRLRCRCRSARPCGLAASRTTPAPAATADPSVHDRDRLARQHECGWAIVRDGCLPRLDGFVGIGWANDLQVGNGAQRGEVLDRLMRRPVLANANRVVREHEQHLGLAERGQSHRRAACSRGTRRTCRPPAARRRATPCRPSSIPSRARERRSTAGARRASAAVIAFWPVSLVPVLPVRSAAPATNPGTPSSDALNAFSIATRVAIFSPCSNVGSVGVPTVDAAAAPQRVPHRRGRPWLASKRSCHSSLTAAPRAAQCVRYASTSSVGAQNGSSGIPITAFVRVTCSAVNGLPCAS